MVKSSSAITALRFICMAVMVVGIAATVDGVLHYRTVPLFMFDVPGWIIGASATYMGLRYWRRIPEMEQKVQGTTFRWSNFSLFKSR